MTKKLLKKIGFVSLGVVGLASLAIPTTMSLVSCSSNSDSKPSFPSESEIQEATAKITTVDAAVEYMNQMFQDHYTLDDLKADFQAGLNQMQQMVEGGMNQPRAGGSDASKPTINFSLESLSANKNQTINFTLNQSVSMTEQGKTYKYNIALAYENIPVKPVLVVNKDKKVEVQIGFIDPKLNHDDEPSPTKPSGDNPLLHFTDSITGSGINGSEPLEEDFWSTSKFTHIQQNTIYQIDAPKNDLSFLPSKTVNIIFPGLEAPTNQNGGHDDSKPPFPSEEKIQAEVADINTIPAAVEYMNQLMQEHYTFSDLENDIKIFLVQKADEFNKTEIPGDDGKPMNTTTTMNLESISANSDQTINLTVQFNITGDQNINRTLEYKNIPVKPLLVAQENGQIKMEIGFVDPSLSNGVESQSGPEGNLPYLHINEHNLDTNKVESVEIIDKTTQLDQNIIYKWSDAEGKPQHIPTTINVVFPQLKAPNTNGNPGSQE